MVEAVWPHYDTLFDLETSAGVVVTTEDHKFFNATTGVWTYAEHFSGGDAFVVAGAGDAHAVGLEWNSVSFEIAFDLTISEFHTYYVGVESPDGGVTFVLAHNTKKDPCGSAPSATPLTDIASDIRTSGLHPAAVNQRTIAVGQDTSGNLYVGSSNGFDAGQREAIDTHGVQRVPGSGSLHAEEELLRAVPDLQRIGTSVRAPCGPGEHNCLQQLVDRGVTIE